MYEIILEHFHNILLSYAGKSSDVRLRLQNDCLIEIRVTFTSSGSVQWLPICSKMFILSNADEFCSILGYTRASKYYGIHVNMTYVFFFLE